MKTNIDTFPQDTNKNAAIVQLQALRKMSLNDRAEMTFRLSNNLRSTVKAGIRQRHPDYSRDQITKAILALTIENALFKKIFPDSEIAP